MGNPGRMNRGVHDKIGAVARKEPMMYASANVISPTISIAIEKEEQVDFDEENPKPATERPNYSNPIRMNRGVCEKNAAVAAREPIMYLTTDDNSPTVVTSKNTVVSFYSPTDIKSKKNYEHHSQKEKISKFI